MQLHIGVRIIWWTHFGRGFFLPAIAKTNCKNVVFIMNLFNTIEDEIYMGTKEFKKYFNIYRVESYQKAYSIFVAIKRQLIFEVYDF